MSGADEFAAVVNIKWLADRGYLLAGCGHYTLCLIPVRGETACSEQCAAKIEHPLTPPREAGSQQSEDSPAALPVSEELKMPAVEPDLYPEPVI